MKPELIKITPTLAKSWMQYNTGNRALPTANAKYYQRLIESGEFTTTHQALAFTGSKENPGRLLDGQTRLTAIIAADTPITQWVFWQCPEEIFAYLDGGKPRSFIDHHPGWDKQKTAFCASICRFIGIGKMTKTDADKIWDGFGECFESLISNCPSCKRGITGTGVRIGACLAMHQNQDRADEISNQYRNMALEKIELLVPSAGRLFARLMGIQGGGGNVQAMQMGLTHKALTPSNFRNTKLYLPDAGYFDAVKTYIKTVAAI